MFRAALIIVTIGLCAALDLPLAYDVFRGHWITDYTVFWQAAQSALSRPEILYDGEAMTLAQDWVGRPGPRPWIYPPSALTALIPFAPLPYWQSYIVFTTTTGAAFFAAAAHYLGSQWRAGLPLVAIAFPVTFAAYSGQMVFLLAAAVLPAIALLPTRPILAGVLFGLAGAVKPQLLILAPLAMIAGRHLASLAASFTAGALLCLLSVALFGWSPWFNWLAALPGFLAMVKGMDIVAWGITPTTILWSAGIDGPVEMAIRTAFIVVAIVAVWRIFRVTPSIPHRLTALIGGGFFCSPYAMNYELVFLMPVAAQLLLGAGRSNGWITAIAAGGLMCAFLNLAPFLAMAFIIVVCAATPGLVPLPRPRSTRRHSTGNINDN